MYKYILFDLDGTLIDSREGITTSVRYALSRMGYDEPDLRKLEVFIGPPLYEAFPEYYGFTPEQTKEAIRYFQEYFRAHGLYNNRLVEGTEKMLRRLKAEGKVLCIASSKPELFVRNILTEQFHIADLFDHIRGGSMDELHCTKSEIIKDLLDEYLHLNKEDYAEVLMVGDRKYDVAGAAVFGIPCLGTDVVCTPEGELEEAGAVKVVHSMEEAEAFILGET